MHSFNILRLLKDGYYIVKLDGCHWRRSFKMPIDKHGLERPVEPLFIRHAFRSDVKHILTAQVMKPSEIVNILTVIVRC